MDPKLLSLLYRMVGRKERDNYSGSGDQWRQLAKLLPDRPPPEPRAVVNHDALRERLHTYNMRQVCRVAGLSARTVWVFSGNRARSHRATIDCISKALDIIDTDPQRGALRRGRPPHIDKGM